MTTRKTGYLATCRHVLIGAQLKFMIELLGSIESALYTAYPKKSTAVRRARAAWAAVSSLKVELDEVYARETPHDRRYWASRVYFGMASPDAWESEVVPILAQHRVEHPACDLAIEALREWMSHDLLTRVQRNSPVCYVTPEERYGAAISALSHGGVGTK